MEVYLLNVSLARFILGTSHDYFVNVALMFGILYPRWESNPQLTALKTVVFTSFTTEMCFPNEISLG